MVDYFAEESFQLMGINDFV
jgi:hypothetical protein